MKRLISTMAAGAVIAGVTFPGVASATQSNGGCLDGNNAGSYVAKITSRTTGTITVKDGKALCQATDIVLESFNVPDAWDGRGFNATAIPQTKFSVTRLTIPAGEKGFSKTMNVAAPDACKNTQVDFYFAPEYEAINGLHDDDARYIHGVLFKGTGACETPPPPITPEEPKPASYKCEALKVVKADRTNFAFTPTVSMTNAKLKKIVYVVKSGDKTVDTIPREDLKSVDYKQDTVGKYTVTATVTVNDKDDVAKGDCTGNFEVVAATTPTPPTPPKKVEVAQTPAPKTLPNTGLGASGILVTFLGVSALGTAFAYAKQRFSGNGL